MRNPFRVTPVHDPPQQPSRHDGVLQEVLDALPLGVVVREPDGNRLLNRRAREGAGDHQRDALLRSAIDGMASRVSEERSAHEVLNLRGSSAHDYAISAERLSDGGVVVVVEDVSERQRLDAIRRDFVANVSHELRTPIGAINLISENLLEETDPQAIALLHQHIASEARRAGHLVEKLLTLSRLESVQPASWNALGLQALLDEVAQRFAPLARQAGIEIEAEANPSSGVIWGDREELSSALGNLLDNALKYSDSGGVIHLEANVEDDVCRISISDTGIGIPAQDQDRVFERFYRVDRARSRETGGAGLGLSIVRHIAENHRGEVSVVSREGEGSRFTLTLPVSP